MKDGVFNPVSGCLLERARVPLLSHLLALGRGLQALQAFEDRARWPCLGDVNPTHTGQPPIWFVCQ